MEKLYTLILNWEEIDTLLTALGRVCAVEASGAEELEMLAQNTADQETRWAAKDLAEICRKVEAKYKALEDKLRGE